MGTAYGMFPIGQEKMSIAQQAGKTLSNSNNCQRTKMQMQSLHHANITGRTHLLVSLARNPKLGLWKHLFEP